jgi:hypothetical protein
VTLAVALLTLLAACGRGTAGGTSTTASPTATAREIPTSAWVTFATGVSYETAMRTVTDLGLQARTFCEGIAYEPPGAAEGSGHWWEPEASPRDFPLTGGPDVGRGRLYVSPTPLAPRDWDLRLDASAGVFSLQTYTFSSCPLHIVRTAPPPDAVHYVAEDEVGTPVRATFGASVTYDDAVVLVSRLGFRMSDPCYEQAKVDGKTPAWQPMGQESGFTTSHQLLVRVTYFNSQRWREQLAEGAGVQMVEAPASTSC